MDPSKVTSIMIAILSLGNFVFEYGMVLKNAVRCAVCDMDYLNTFIEDTQNGKKLKIAKIDSEGCNQILDQCLVSIQL